MYHVEKIHGPQEHFCKHCPFSVFMIEGFKVHMETAHPEKAGRYIYSRSYIIESNDLHSMAYLEEIRPISTNIVGAIVTFNFVLLLQTT